MADQRRRLYAGRRAPASRARSSTIRPWRNSFRASWTPRAAARNRGREAAIDAARDRFYRGDIARDIVEVVRCQRRPARRKRPRRISRPKSKTPVSASTIAASPCINARPWSQGPGLPAATAPARRLRPRARWATTRADYIHHLVEAAKLAFADREQYYGDPEFTTVPLEGLLSQRYAELASRADRSGAAPRWISGLAIRSRCVRCSTRRRRRRARGARARSTSRPPTAAAT